jgi:large subunit ribosomal protein L6
VSRIGRLPVTVPSTVKVEIQGSSLKVQGPQGVLNKTFSPAIHISQENGQILVTRESDSREHRALHGTTRALINNMVVGVSTGFDKILEIDGVGYRSEMNGKNLVLYVGYSHPVVIEPPDGITFEVDTKTRQVKIHGHDIEQLGQIAANIRKVRPPEPYHGKGIRYAGEKIRRKAGKSGKAKK